MTLRCLIRKEEVKATPEEKIRQAFIAFLVQEKKIPLRAIGIELSLSHLPHLKHQPVPVDRRIDLLVFCPQQKPLLLVECKALKLNDFHESQLFGYNAFVKAPFVALVGASEMKFFGHPHFPSYPEMLMSLQKLTTEPTEKREGEGCLI